jgi:hypothetical protein
MAGGLVLLATRRSGHPLAGHLHQLIPDLRIRRQACKPDAILRISFHPSVSCHGAHHQEPFDPTAHHDRSSKKIHRMDAHSPKKMFVRIRTVAGNRSCTNFVNARRLSFAGVGRRPKSRSDPGGGRGLGDAVPSRACPPSTWPRHKPGPFCGPQRSRPGRSISPHVRQALVDRYRCSKTK